MCYVLIKRKKCLVYVSKLNSERKNKLFVQKFKINKNALLRRITSTDNGDFYCLNCLHSIKTKNKLKFHKMFYEIRDSFGVTMPSNGTKI